MPPCDRKWNAGEKYYRCLTCQKQDTAALCYTCVSVGPHHGHNVVQNTSLQGGSCDCGDEAEAYFAQSSWCPAHGGPEVRGLCGRPFGAGDSFYRCFDCQTDPDAALCEECAQSPTHQGHDISKRISNGNGTCDCGDGRYFLSPACDSHSGKHKAFIPTLSSGKPGPSVFISYSHRDQDVVRSLTNGLAGFSRVWIDHEHLKDGEWLYSEVALAMYKSDFVLVCISDSFLQSENCLREIAIAEEFGKAIIPLKVASMDIWPPPDFHCNLSAALQAGGMYVRVESRDKTEVALKEIESIFEADFSGLIE